MADATTTVVAPAVGMVERQHALILQNLSWVRWHVRYYYPADNHWVNREDMEQAAACRMVECLGWYDASRGPLRGYVHQIMPGTIYLEWSQAFTPFAVSRQSVLSDDLRRYLRAVEREGAREPGYRLYYVHDALVATLGLTLGRMTRLDRFVRAHEPLDVLALDPPDYRACYGEEERERDEQRRRDVGRALDRLTPRERLVVCARTMDGETLERVGERLGVTKERVRQIQVRAEEKLRNWLWTVEGR